MWLDLHVKSHIKTAQKAAVFLNNQKLDYCFAANEEECWADVFVMTQDAKDWFYRRGVFPIVRLYGYVEFKIS